MRGNASLAYDAKRKDGGPALRVHGPMLYAFEMGIRASVRHGVVITTVGGFCRPRGGLHSDPEGDFNDFKVPDRGCPGQSSGKAAAAAPPAVGSTGAAERGLRHRHEAAGADRRSYVGICVTQLAAGDPGAGAPLLRREQVHAGLVAGDETARSPWS